MSIAESSMAKLAEIKDIRKANRVLRIKAPRNCENEPDSTEIINYLNQKRPVHIDKPDTIEPAFFPAPPPAPIISPEKSCLPAIAVYYPIGRYPENDDWYIVSPYIHVPREFIPTELWLTSPQRYLAAICHACKLIQLLEKELQKTLPHPITFKGNRYYVSMNGKDYDILQMQPMHEFRTAVSMLCTNAFVLSGGESKSALLPNLYFLLNPGTDKLPPIDGIDDLLLKDDEIDKSMSSKVSESIPLTGSLI